MLYSFYKKGEKAPVLFLLFVLQSCSPNAIDKQAPAVNEIKSGEIFTIILPENHTEQAYWRTKETSKKLVEELNAVWHGNEKGVYFNYMANKTGTDTIRFAKLKQTDTLEKRAYIVKVN